VLTFLKDRADAVHNNAVKFGLVKPQVVAVKPAPLFKQERPRLGMFDHMMPLRRGISAFSAIDLRYLDTQGGLYRGESRPTPTPPDYSAIGARIAALARKAFPDGVDRDLYPESCGPIRQVLEEGGFTWLGAGHFSVVVAHRDHPERAFKFGLKKEDSGAAYAAWCRANPGDHVPEVFHTERFQNGYFVALPLLKRYHEGEDAYMDIQYRVAVAAVHQPLTTDKEHRLAQSLGAGTIARTASAIGVFFAGLAQIDLHAENVMVGTYSWGGKCLVITDPVSFSTTKG
jgi:hypothetical protein